MTWAKTVGVECFIYKVQTHPLRKSLSYDKKKIDEHIPFDSLETGNWDKSVSIYYIT